MAAAGHSLVRVRPQQCLMQLYLHPQQCMFWGCEQTLCYHTVCCSACRVTKTRSASGWGVEQLLSTTLSPWNPAQTLLPRAQAAYFAALMHLAVSFGPAPCQDQEVS